MYENQKENVIKLETIHWLKNNRIEDGKEEDMETKIGKVLRKLIILSNNLPARQQV